MAAAGYATEGPELRGPNGWRGSLKDVEHRIKTLTQQRADAQSALDETLIDDDARAKREAEDKVFYAALNTMDLKGDGTGTGLVAFTKDGDVLPVSDMTPAQRKAFERFEAAQRPRETVTV